MTPSLRPVAAVLALLLAALPAASQTAALQTVAPQTRAAAQQTPSGATVRVVEETPGAVTYEVTARWDRPISDVTSAQSADGLAASLVGGQATASALVELGSRVPPRVEVVSVDAEEARIDGAERVAEAFAGPLAEVVSVGTRRRQLVGSLRIRLVRVEGDRVSRVRRATVRVQRTTPVAGFAMKASGGGSSHLAVTRSALAEGQWFKLPVRESGVYRVTRELISELGLDPATVDPARVAAYHNGGAPLPEVTSTPRPADLVETRSLVIGGGDGSFGENDAVILYAEGPRTWTWDPGSEFRDDDDRWAHVTNPFTFESYVFLRVDAAAPARVEGATFPNWTDAAPLATVTGRLVAERELVNLEREDSGSGLQWLGEEITRASTGVTVLDTVVANRVGPVRYLAQVAGRAERGMTIALEQGAQTLASVRTSSVVLGSPTAPIANLRTAEATASPQSSLAVRVTAPGALSTVTAWLDWVEATFERAPRATNGVVQFPTPGGRPGRFEVALEGFSAAPEVWDVTDSGDVRRLGVQPQGGTYRVQVEADTNGAREVVAFDPGAPLRTFSGGTRVENQNLHGITDFPDYVIVTAPEFAPAAEDLAAHRQADGLQPLVVHVDEILNEFGGGTADMRAIRDYMKFLYDRAPDEARLPKHLLLFGDGHYDFRGIKNGPPNFVPTYQTEEMLWRVRSYTSDDYFALLDDDEGEWRWPGDSNDSFERVDLGVGRLPFRTPEDAEMMVDKIIRYEDPQTYGDWRTRMTFLADDQYPSVDTDSDLHVQNTEAVATRVTSESPEMTVQKIYLPSYPEVNGATGRRRPDATDASRRALNEGTLVWNYMGHGGPKGLADEQLFTRSVVDNLTNEDRLSIFVTATCSFGKFDIVDAQSLAEETLLYENGGGIAMFTTTRVVYTNTSVSTLNLGLNIELTRDMLARGKDGRPRRLGDILADTKNSDIGAQGNNRKFSLLGDPGMRIGLPERTVRITHVNGEPLPAGTAPRLRAFDTARVQGEVLGRDGAPDPTFEGAVSLNVFDAKRRVQLPIREHTSGFYEVQTDPIYAGRASVRGGRFDATFLVPQDVSYSGEPARISVYALGDGTDGLGQTQEAIVAEDAGTRPNDAVGPRIRLFLDDSTFVSGGITRPDPVLIARLRDESGINTVGAGVGHELLLTIDGDPTQAVDLGRYYEGDLDTYQSGTVRFPLADLEPGRHTLTLTAWDGANNASVETLDFVVAEGTDLVVENAYPYPNPTPGRSTFFFEHNQPPGTDARVQLRIYSLAGRAVRTMEHDGPLTGGMVRVEWDGLDDDLDPLASGIYLYRLRVEVDGEDGARRVAERRDKLAVIR